MTHDLIFIANSISAKHVASLTSNRKSLATVVSLDYGNHLRGQHIGVLKLTDLVDSVEAEGDLGQHISHFQLRNLHGSERLAKLLAVKHVITSLMEAELGSTHSSPGNSKAGLVKAAERTLKSFHIKHVFLGHFYIFHHDHSSGRSAERKLSFDLRGGDASHLRFLQNKATDITLLVLGPDNKDLSMG